MSSLYVYVKLGCVWWSPGTLRRSTWSTFRPLAFPPALLAVHGSVWVGLEGDFAGFAAFTALGFVQFLRLCFAFPGGFEQIVPFQPWPPRFGVWQHLRVGFEPSHHVEEAFGAFLVALRQRLVAEVADFVEVGDFR